MKLRVFAALTLLFLITGKHYLYAQESIIGSISEDYISRLISTARENYPRVKAYQARVDVTRASVAMASVSIFDALTLSYIYQPSNNVSVVDPANPSSRFISGLQLGVFINLGTILRTPMNIRRAKAERRVAEAEQAEYDLSLATEVRRRYYTYLQKLSELKLQTRSFQEAESAMKDMEYKYKKGEETFSQFNQIQLQLTQTNQTKIQAEAGLFTAKAELEELLGDKLETVK